jgi:hypothetical protein
MQKRIGWMFWGSISGRYGKGAYLFWEKDWGNINQTTYCEYTLPVVQEYMQTHPGLLFQQDNAGPHAAAGTTFAFMCAGITVIKWPPFSPDLNPIETLWDWMKDYIQAIDSSIHKSYPKLKKVVQQAWDAIDNSRVLELVSGEAMRKRCRDVIKAEGRNTEW